jgi:hypothetical protein
LFNATLAIMKDFLSFVQWSGLEAGLEYHRLTEETKEACRAAVPAALDTLRWLAGRLERGGEYGDYRQWQTGGTLTEKRPLA